MWGLLAECIRSMSDTSYTVHGYPITDLAKAAGSVNTINEKTALEYALGDSLSKKRSTVIVKNVGVNALADPLVMASTQGIMGGVVLISGDDTEVRGTQVRQDTRPYAEVASVPLVELDTGAVRQGLEMAFAESEKYSRVAILRVTDVALYSATGEGPPLMQADRRYGRLADRALTAKGCADRADRIFKGKGEVPEAVESGGRTLGLCRNCPYKPLLQFISDEGIEVIIDTGCVILARKRPYNIGVANYGLGSSIAVAAKSTGIAVIGDYAFLHSGINSLIDVYERGTPLLTIILKNGRLGMTGGEGCFDVERYISWAGPERMGVEEAIGIMKGSVTGPRTIVIETECPEGEIHEEIGY
ncbi:MAG: thiamine pyrophosphate-dependent enzyme [Methanomassiliicoccaceae archaeon]|nr:thiamine pyrophosphate-dependent enzyme [Methanomassiliicoccaceae archaeon]